MPYKRTAWHLDPLKRDAWFLLAILLLSCRCSADSNGNLLENSSFESGDSSLPDGWKWNQWDDSVGSWDATHAYDGVKSAKLTGLNGGWSATSAVNPGAVHRLKFHYRQEGATAKIVASIRKSGQSKPLLYRSSPAISASEKSEFIEGQFVERADAEGWVEFDAGYFVPSEGETSVGVLIKLVGTDPSSTVWIDDVRISAIESESVPDSAAVLKYTDNATIWTENENRKIFPAQEPPSEKVQEGIRLDLARGEYGVFQIAVSPQEDWKHVNWKVNSLSDEFSSSGIVCRRIEYVAVDDPIKPFAIAGLHPDPLTERLPCDIAAGVNQTFWFTAKVPADQKPGTYTVTASLVRSDGEESLSVCDVPIRIRVRNFSLPSKPSIDAFARMHTKEVRNAEYGQETEVLRRYYHSYFEHRVRCSLGATVGVRLRDNDAIVNADRFIEQLRFVRDEFGPRPFFLSALWIAHEHHRMPLHASWKGRRIFANAELTALNPEFEKPFEDFVRQLVSQLRTENLLSDAIVRFIDEPVLDHEPTRNGIRTLAKLIKRIDPTLAISLTTTTPHPDLFDVVDIWVLHTDAWKRSQTQIAAAKKLGAEIHVYNNGIAYLEQDGMRMRMWPWLLKKYDVDGTYSWCGTTAWRNEMEDPWTCRKSYFEVMFYPPRNKMEQGPIESVRWELFRQGLQDFEYMQLVEGLVASLEAKGRADKAKVGREALAQALQLVEKWPRVRPANDRPYTRDVTKLEAARRRLSDAIELMQTTSN